MEYKFKVGDRVKSIADYGKGEYGTVIKTGPFVIDVNFDNGTTWGKDSHNIIPAAPSNKILITSDGATTLARLYDGKKVIKSAEAKCSPDDTYDFTIGANLAYDRLMRPTAKTEPVQDKPTKEPVKLYCVKALSDWLTVGKVYESVDDYITVDNGIYYTAKYMREGKYIVPLVKRPAKVGEWVYMTAYHGGDLTTGTLHKCTVDGVFDGKYLCRSNTDYLVLDGYTPEEPAKAKEEPKGWTGKVVCVAKDDDYWSEDSLTVGKVYSIKDGVFYNNSGFGNITPKYTDVPNKKEKFVYASFIEYKGEQA